MGVLHKHVDCIFMSYLQCSMQRIHVCIIKSGFGRYKYDSLVYQCRHINIGLCEQVKPSTNNVRVP